MSAADIYSKTALGRDEVENHKLHLPSRLRTMLIMVDGRKTAAALKDDAAKFGCPADFLESLEAAGLIARSGESSKATAVLPLAAAAPESAVALPAQDEYTRFRAAKDFMNNAVVNALGMRAFFFTLKLERAGNVADLRELVKPFKDAITKGTSEAEAELLTQGLLEKLG